MRFEGVVVDLAVVGPNTVLRGVEDLAREIHLRAVREVPAMIETHAEDGIARLQHGQIHRGIRLRTRVRLHVGVVGAEELLGAIDSQLLGDIHVLATTVIALARIAFGIFVGEHGTLRLEHARARIVLGGDQLDVIFLTLPFGAHRSGELWVESGNGHLSGEHRRGLGKAGGGKRRILAEGGGWPALSSCNQAKRCSTTAFQAEAMFGR